MTLIGTFILGFTVVCIGAFIMGCTGFGFALMVVPPLMLFLPKEVVVPLNVVMSTVGTSMVAWHARRHLNLRLIVPLCLGGLIGFPIGVHFLVSLDAALVKTAAGLLSMVFSAALFFGWRAPMRSTVGTNATVGCISGLLGGSVSIPGPPVILFMTNQQLARDLFRANIVTFFVSLNLIGITTFLARGMLTPRVMGYAGGFIPALLLGTFAGTHVAHRVPEAMFRKIAITLAFVMGTVLFVANVRGCFPT